MVTWREYLIGLILVTCGGGSAIVFTLLCFLSPWFGFLFILELFLFTVIAIDEDESQMPDFFHMDREAEYLIQKAQKNRFSDRKSYVFVKLFPGFWVETPYHHETFEEFMEFKIDYQHKMKETFKV